MKNKLMFLCSLLMFLFSLNAYVATAAIPEKDSLLYKMLEVWDQNSNNDKEKLIEVLRAYNIDPGFLTSGKPIDGFIEQELRFIMRNFNQNAKPEPYQLQKLNEYISMSNNEMLYPKLLLFFGDIEKILEVDPTVTAYGKSQASMQAEMKVIKDAEIQRESVRRQNAENARIEYKKATKAYEETKRQRELEQQKKDEEFKKEAQLRAQEIKDDEEAERKGFEALHKKAIKKGYKAGACGGLEAVIVDIYNGLSSLNEAKKCLVVADDSDLNSFKVESIVGKYIIYSNGFSGLRFALLKESGKFYGDGGSLTVPYFKIVGSQQFTRVLGSISELIVLKRVIF